jgi:pimeloyl-ACP methyl ester carboxylesterase
VPISRRQFLLGTGGLVVAAGAGVEVAGRDRVLHRLGLRGSPDAHVPKSGWPVVEGKLPSGVPWALARPPGEVTGAVLCLHGRGDDHRFAFDEVPVHDHVADEGEHLAVAACDGGPESYWHPRADGSDAGTVVVDELVPAVRQALGVERFAVLGWSMGGYGALRLGQLHPDLFPVVVGSSPALYTRWEDVMPGAFDDAKQFARDDVFARAGELDGSKVRIDCGEQDPFLAADEAFAARLGDDVTTNFTRGYHDAAFWRSVAGAQVRFVASKL